MRTFTPECRPLCWLVSHVLLVIMVSVHAQAQCTWTDTPDHQGVGTSAGAQQALFTIQDCRDACDAIDACVAVDYAVPGCNFFASVTSETYLFGRTLSRKTCPTTTVATTAATTECKMDQKNGHRGVDTDNEPSLAVDTATPPGCQALCRVVTACLAYTVGIGQCDMHTSEVPNLISNSGYRHANKKECNGGQCCFSDDIVDTQGTGGTKVTLLGTPASCSSVCEQIESCYAASFSGTTCTFFYSRPNDVPDTAATFFTKDCRSGSARGTLAVTKCDATQGAHLSKLLVGCTVFVALLLAKTG